MTRLGIMVALIALFCVAAFAQNTAQTVVINGTPMMALNAFGDTFDAAIDYDNVHNGFSIALDYHTVSLTPYSRTMWVDDRPVTLDAPVVIIDDVTYVPVMTLCDIFGYSCRWNDRDNQLVIFDPFGTYGLVIVVDTTWGQYRHQWRYDYDCRSYAHFRIVIRIDDRRPDRDRWDEQWNRWGDRWDRGYDDHGYRPDDRDPRDGRDYRPGGPVQRDDRDYRPDGREPRDGRDPRDGDRYQDPRERPAVEHEVHTTPQDNGDRPHDRDGANANGGDRPGGRDGANANNGDRPGGRDEANANGGNQQHGRDNANAKDGDQQHGRGGDDGRQNQGQDRPKENQRGHRNN